MSYHFRGAGECRLLICHVQGVYYSGINALKKQLSLLLRIYTHCFEALEGTQICCLLNRIIIGVTKKDSNSSYTHEHAARFIVRPQGKI